MAFDSLDESSERSELHFLAALIDELMKALATSGALDRARLQAIENAVADRIGSSPRAW